ncbi:hypothetical protein DFH06DRAFT_1249411, partial [Mycena polygramma]
TYPYGRMDIDRRPVHALSLVCSHWRRVAHTTPRLWTEHMETNLKKTPTAKYIARMADWLERSAPLPVPVAIHCCGLRGETRGTKVGPLVAVFVTAAHRWSRAEFSIDSLSALSQIPVNSLQSLEKLRLTSEDVNNHAQVQAFLTAARLRDVTLFTGCTAQLLMPWSQLTTINVKDMSPWDCLDTLVQCTTVVTAEFETKTWAVPPDLSGRQITTLARLENLEISFRHSDTGFFSPFFARLALPGLKNLSLSLNPDIIWQSLDFTRFQLGSPNIERLTIYNSDLTAQDLITVLRHAPSLVGLDTMYCPVSLDDSLLTSLRYSKTDTVHLAPSLQSLSLTEAGRNFEDNVLDTMIQSRWWMDDQSLAFPSAPKVSRWSYIYIACGEREGEMDPEFEAKLETYRLQGLDVNVYSGYGE